MRHGKKNNHLGRTTSHRKAMLANMASSLIKHKRISTTLAKAKVLRGYVEPLITKSKTDTTHSRRIVFSYLQDKEAIKTLFGEIAESNAPSPMPNRPRSIAARRESRSTNLPINGESKPESSEIVRAMPISESEISKPLAMIATNGGVNR